MTASLHHVIYQCYLVALIADFLKGNQNKIKFPPRNRLSCVFVLILQLGLHSSFWSTTVRQSTTHWSLRLVIQFEHPCCLRVIATGCMQLHFDHKVIRQFELNLQLPRGSRKEFQNQTVIAYNFFEFLHLRVSNTYLALWVTTSGFMQLHTEHNLLPQFRFIPQPPRSQKWSQIFSIYFEIVGHRTLMPL